MSESLKPCPFCGGEATVLTDTAMFVGFFWTAGCETSWCRGNVRSGPMYYSKEDAVKAWNERVIEPNAAKIIHELFEKCFYEDPDYADDYYRADVEALGVDVSDVKDWLDQ